MQRRSRAIAAGILALGLVPFAAVAQQSDIVNVDVEVVDANGRPITGLKPEAFEVAIGGQSRSVVSAEYVPGQAAESGRVFALAIDAASFGSDEALGVAVAAQALVDRMPRTDRVGFFTYPSGPQVEPTIDRVAIRKAVEDVAPQPPSSGTAYARALDAVTKIAGALTALPGRKIVVLVSAASIGSEPAASGPDADSTLRISQQSAESNLVLYTLFVGRGFLEITMPRQVAGAGTPPARRRDDEAVERWLAEVSGRTGGALMKIAGPNPEPAVRRILDETAGFYRLGVEASGEARNGRLRALSVKPRQPDLTVRGPSWLRVAESSMSLAPGSPAAAKPGPTPDGAPAGGTSSGDPILTAYEHRDYTAVSARLAQHPDLARWIRGLRTGRRPWPEAPRRAGVLALEVSAVALATDEAPAVAEAVNLLLQQGATVRAPGEPDAFECDWFRAGLTLFEAGHPEAGEPFAKLALARCPQTPRIVLADAVLADQRSPVLSPAIRIGPAAVAEAAAHQAVLDRYETARQFPETEFEARIREAWLLYRLKKYEEALALTEDLTPPAATDAASESARQMQYVSHFVRASVLRERREFDAAIEAYRRALEAWPDGQTVRVSLMTLLAMRGQRERAETLATDIEAAPGTAVDPWWLFWNGDRSLYPALIARLREGPP
jgi:VWFA-related protein